MAYPLKPIAAAVAGVTLCVALSGFKQNNPPAAPVAPSVADTVPAPKLPAAPRIADFTDLQQQLQRAEASLKRAQSDLKLPEPAELEKAMKAVDWQKMEADIARSMEVAMKAQEALVLIDTGALNSQLQAAMGKAQMQQAKQQQEAMKKVEANLRNLQPQIEEQMKKAALQLERAKEEMTAYENFVNGLADDGLLNRSEYKIEHKNKTLIIDGKLQPEAVYNKHRNFLEKKKDFTISKSVSGLQINKGEKN